MKKLVAFFDDHFLKFGVAFAILFVALYPKLPSIQITHTWVYVRLEDFLILLLALVWFIQLLRKKVSLPRPEGYALIGYWVVGLISLAYCLLFIAPQLQNFFPKIAAFQYVRRIEYMILFFIAFSTVKNKTDVYFYLKALVVTIIGIVLYAFGQRFYLILWNAFPSFFEKYPFCFPAFLTGNEEFAKGIPLCLNEASRITSTFGGHYDLAAYMVLVIPILIALVFAVKRKIWKVLLIILALFALETLNFTSSRVSFGAYVAAVIGMFVLWNRKRWIIPVLVLSLGIMLLSSSSTLQRFEKTIQEVQIVSVKTDETTLSDDLKKIIAETKKADELSRAEVPPASEFTVGAEESVPTASLSSYTTVLTETQIQKLQDKDIEISTVSGGLLIQKAYALDISFTTRFQAEWPRNWKAFLYSPVFGTGYSSLTLATDNDYLRALGETGLAGLLAFLFIFLILGIFMKNVIGSVKDDIVKAFLFGLAGGVIGLLVNAALIDVFEASKVAEPLWLLLGIGVGAGALYKKKAINYKKELVAFFTSTPMIGIYCILLIAVVYGSSIHNFFVADDFTWLRWAATTNPSDVPKYFMDSTNFFYRPLDKVVVYVLYTLFSFQPQAYHAFILLLHSATTIGVYLLGKQVLKAKLLPFLAALLFALHPAHTENIFWFSTISIALSSFFIIYALLAYLHFRKQQSVLGYISTILLSILAFLSYEIAVVIPFLVIILDVFIVKPKRSFKNLLVYLPFFVLVVLYFVIRSLTHAFSGGGDYSYNMFKLVPNVIGNYLGYIGLFIGGLSFLPLYDATRETLRIQWTSVLAGVVVLSGILGYWLYSMRRKLLKHIKHPNVGYILFGFVFAFVSLLPFLPLGNIAPRYLYLASFGFSFAFVIIVAIILRSISLRDGYLRGILCALIVIVMLFYYGQNKAEQEKWAHAGKLTKATLTYFRTGYENFDQSTKVYIVDTPIKQNGVWVFPVGLTDGIWFIYRDKMPSIHQIKTLEEAKAAKVSQPTNSYIFQFDDKGIISEVH